MIEEEFDWLKGSGLRNIRYRYRGSAKVSGQVCFASPFTTTRMLNVNLARCSIAASGESRLAVDCTSVQGLRKTELGCGEAKKPLFRSNTKNGTWIRGPIRVFLTDHPAL